MADIVKTMLSSFVKEAVAVITPEHLSLGGDSSVETRGEGPSWINLAIKGLHHNVPRVFEVRVTEKVG